LPAQFAGRPLITHPPHHTRHAAGRASLLQITVTAKIYNPRGMIHNGPQFIHEGT
jgi:hypothetical protein